MPTAVDKLTKNNSPDAIQKAIGECIAMEIRGGEEKDRAVAMCYNMARKKTGKELGKVLG